MLAGTEAKNNAGPAILVSFICAGIASIFSAICYAELGARVPKAGSAYTYTYVCVGELVAFIIGWDMVLEYTVTEGVEQFACRVLVQVPALFQVNTSSPSTTSHKVGAAAVARSLSGYIQELAGIAKYVPTNADYIAVAAVIILCICMAFGVQTSTNLNSFFTITNLVVIAFVVVYGAILAEPSNWCRRFRSAKIVVELFSKSLKNIFISLGFCSISKHSTDSGLIRKQAITRATRKR